MTPVLAVVFGVLWLLTFGVALYLAWRIRSLKRVTRPEWVPTAELSLAAMLEELDAREKEILARLGRREQEILHRLEAAWNPSDPVDSGTVAQTASRPPAVHAPDAQKRVAQAEQVLALAATGMSADDIARKLRLGKGEVNLLLKFAGLSK